MGHCVVVLHCKSIFVKSFLFFLFFFLYILKQKLILLKHWKVLVLCVTFVSLMLFSLILAGSR